MADFQDDPRIKRRYAPMSRDHIPGFPHKLPKVNWGKNLPMFQDENIDDPLLHLIKFHIHSSRLKGDWHEDCLMKIFMGTLEGKAREWYEALKPASLFSLKDFHKVFYEHYKEDFPSLSLAENCCDQAEDLINYLKNIDEDFGNWSPEDLLEEVQNFHSQVKCHNNQEELNKDEISQEINQYPQNPSVLTNDVSFNVLNGVKDNNQPHDQLLDKGKNNCHFNLRIQRFPSPLTEEEINLLLNMQPSSKYLHNEEIVSTYSNVDECTKVFIHEGTKEQVDAHVILPSQKGPLLDITPIEQNNDFKTECNQSNQDILGLLEEKYADPMFIIDDIPFSEDLPKYDQYDDNFDNFTRQSLAILKDEILELQFDEDFLRAFFLLLKSRKCSPQIKKWLLDIISENYENEIKLLHSQIQSYNFRNPKEFFENLPSPKQEEIVLSFDLHIEEDYSFKQKTEEISSWSNIHNLIEQLVIEGLEVNNIHHAFIDPISDYMENLLSPNLQTCFLYKDQIHQKWHLHIISVIIKAHDHNILPILITSNQVIHLFLQLLDWLHWHFCIT